MEENLIESNDAQQVEGAQPAEENLSMEKPMDVEPALDTAAETPCVPSVGIDSLYTEDGYIYARMKRDDIPGGEAVLDGIDELFQNLKMLDINQQLQNGGFVQMFDNAGGQVFFEELFHKNNGEAMAQLRDSSKQVLENLNIRPAGGAAGVGTVPIPLNLIAMAVAVVTIITKTQYLKKINARLDRLENMARDILVFLDRDKRTQIEGDILYLEDIHKNMDAYRASEELRRAKLDGIQMVEQRAAGSMLFYERSLQEKLGIYTRREKKKRKLEGKELERLKEEYYYYRWCVELTMLTRMLELQLLEGCTAALVKTAEDHLGAVQARFDQINGHLMESIVAYNTNKFSNKLKTAALTAAGFYGELPPAVRDIAIGLPVQTILEYCGVSVGDSIVTLTNSMKKELVDGINDLAEYVVSEEDRKTLERYREPLELYRGVIEGKVQLLVNEQDILIRVPEAA